MNITQKNLSADIDPVMDSELFFFAKLRVLRSDDAVSGLFERVSRRAINIFDLRTTSEDLTKLLKRSVDSSE